jgi:DNA invertase Pin-like site-specific DNA recombinase
MGFKPRIAPQVAAYVRVSSRSQDVRTQRAALERAAAARGDVITRWYSEKRSASRLRRPQLDQLRADARAGQLRRLYVFRLDRLTRTGIRDTLALFEELRRHGCELKTLADGFDLSGPAAEVVLAVLAWAAQLERQALGERIRAARERVEAAGDHWGRPRRMSTDQVRRARALQRRGHTLRSISARLKIARSTLHRSLARTDED